MRIVLLHLVSGYYGVEVKAIVSVCVGYDEFHKEKFYMGISV